jgi:hypothetical protein
MRLKTRNDGVELEDSDMDREIINGLQKNPKMIKQSKICKNY